MQLNFKKKKDEWRSMLLRPLTLAILAMMVLGSISAYMFIRPAPHRATVPTAEVSWGDVHALVSLSGQVDVNQTITVQADVSGQVTQLLVHPGSVVKSGQPLVEFDGYTAAKQNYDTMVDREKMMRQLADLAQQHLNLDRQHSATQAAINQDQAVFAAAKAQVEVANTLSADASRAYQLASQVSPQQAVQAQTNLDNAITAVTVDNALLQQATTKLNSDQQNAQQTSVAQIAEDNAAVAVDQQQLNSDEQVATDLQQQLFQGQQSNTQSIQSAKQSLDQANGQLSLYQVEVIQDQNQLNTDESNKAPSSQLALDMANLAIAQQELANAKVMAVDAQTIYNSLVTNNGSIGTASEQASLDKARGAVNIDQALLNQVNVKLQNDKNSTSTNTLVAQDSAAVNVAQQQFGQAKTLLNDAVKAFSVANEVDKVSQNQAKTNEDQAYGNVKLDRSALEQAQVKLYNDSAPAAKAVLLADEEAVVQAKVSADEAQLNVDSAKKALDQNQLTAPVAGTVVSVTQVVGDLVAPQETICTLNPAVPDHQIIGLVASSNVSNIKVGDKVQIHSDSFRGSLNGTISFISPVPELTQNTNTYQYQVYVHVDTLPKDVLSGMPVNIDVETGTVSHVLVVPASAVMVSGDKMGVYVQEKGNQYKFVSVTVVRSDSSHVEVSNLKLGSIVALKRPNG